VKSVDMPFLQLDHNRIGHGQGSREGRMEGAEGVDIDMACRVASYLVSPPVPVSRLVSLSALGTTSSSV
jgi:hypothetical protein